MDGKKMDETARLTGVTPSKRQLKLQQMEFYAFFHFSMNTFTGREWGDGTDSPGLFQPSCLDGRQWARAVKAAGMRGAILTCKHHDGFCLWPSHYTDYTVASSPYQGGRGDVVGEIAKACREEGLAFGVYLSPWDRHEACYGEGKAYDDFFVNQLTELLTGYGDIFCVWLDGACGEGKNGRKQVYDWKRYYETVRRLQPDACIHICGPDIRWCGNEAGDTRPEEWSVVPARLACPEGVAEKSQQQDDSVFRQRPLTKMDQDLGSRRALEGETDLIWYPAEVDTSIRPGWFYHEEEDGQVKSLEELVGIYDRSAGGNATLLLNIPADRRGLVHEQDAERLRELGDYLRKRFAKNWIGEARLEADDGEIGDGEGAEGKTGHREGAEGETGHREGAEGKKGLREGVEGETDDERTEHGKAADVGENSRVTGHGIEGIREPGYERYYRPAMEKPQYELVMTWEKPIRVGCVVLKEHIPLSQRIERFELLNETDGTVLYAGAAVGYQKIMTWPAAEVKSLRLRILESRGIPALSYIGVYEGC